jgi:predicted nucleic acid-binding protein
MSKNIITDTGFWIAYFEERDAYHKEAVEVAFLVFGNKIICPFPSLYEFLNTRFTRDIKKIRDYEFLLSKLDVEYIYDDEYRVNIIDDFILRNKTFQKISLVDMIINQIIEDVNIKVDYIVTFNRNNFMSSCIKRGIDFLP